MQTTACVEERRGGPSGCSDTQDSTYGTPGLVWREPERASTAARGDAARGRQRRFRLAQTVNSLHPQAKTRFAMRILEGRQGFQNRRARRLGRHYGLAIPSALLFGLEPAIAAGCPSCPARAGCPREGMEYGDMFRAVSEARRLGVRLFLAAGSGTQRYAAEFLDLALRTPDCTYLLFADRFDDEALAAQAAAAGNLGFVLQELRDQPPAGRGGAESAGPPRNETARLLREVGAPFGLVAALSPASIDEVCEDAWLDQALEEGCLFVFLIPETAPEQGRVLHFLNREVALLRQGSPIPLFNLQQDLVFTSERIAPSSGRTPLLVHPVTSRVRSLTLVESIESAWPAAAQGAAGSSPCPLLLDRADTRGTLYAMLAR